MLGLQKVSSEGKRCGQISAWEGPLCWYSMSRHFKKVNAKAGQARAACLAHRQAGTKLALFRFNLLLRS